MNSHKWVDQQKQWQWRDLIPVVKVEVIAVSEHCMSIDFLMTMLVIIGMIAYLMLIVVFVQALLEKRTVIELQKVNPCDESTSRRWVVKFLIEVICIRSLGDDRI